MQTLDGIQITEKELLAKLDNGSRLRWLPRSVSGISFDLDLDGEPIDESDLFFDHYLVDEDEDWWLEAIVFNLIEKGILKEVELEDTGIIDILRC